ncbi:substrate-binding domain-containing protein, partial [Microbacterium sp.]|uniref:substrate-binding domain-containing protein n=1 Tax=Microbacterium sp. TaxID=51671 RepID=UPI0032C24288
MGRRDSVERRKHRDHEPGVDVVVTPTGTTAGFRAFCNGEIDISNASRPISDDEIAAC